MILKLRGHLSYIKWGKLVFVWNQSPITCLDDRPGKKPFNRREFWIKVPKGYQQEMQSYIGLNFLVHVETAEYDFTPPIVYGKREHTGQPTTVPLKKTGIAFKLVSIERDQIE